MSRSVRMVVIIAALVASVAAPTWAEPAVKELQRDQQALVAAKHAVDWHGYLAAALRLQAFVNNAPASWLEVARARQQLGDTTGALRAVARFVALGQTSPLLTGGMFPKLTQDLTALAAANAGTIANGRATGMTIAAGLPAEDIAYDPTGRRFLVSTVLGDGIVAIDPATHAVTPFATAPDQWPMLALALDPLRRRLWATEVALTGFTSVPKADQGRSTLLEYDLDRRTLLARYPGPPGASLGDMALDPAGDPIVADGDGGGLYRLQGGALHRIDHGDFVSPQTVAVCDDGRHVFVPDYVRGIAALDLRTGAVRWLSGQDHALAGIDGLYCHGHTLVATQNGTSPERVVSFQLDRDAIGIVGEHLIARNADGDFTHGVPVGNAFYYISAAGWNALDEHGLRAGSPAAEPASIDRTALPAS